MRYLVELLVRWAVRFQAYNVSNTVQIGSHALAGGILSDLQGGKFGHGFFSAGIMKGVGKFNAEYINDVMGGTLVQAMVGGTISKITGGKFANGAVTSAIQFVVNERSAFVDKMKSWGKTVFGWGQNVADSVKGLYDGAGSVFTGSYRSVRYLGRSSGVLGQAEFDDALQEGLMVDAGVAKAVEKSTSDL